MKWRDMPEAKRPVLVKLTDYPELMANRGETFEEFKGRMEGSPSFDKYISRKARELDDRYFNPEGGCVFAREPEKGRVMFLGTEAPPRITRHEIGHIVNIRSPHRPFRAELDAEKFRLKHEMRLGELDPTSRIDAISYLETKLPSSWGRKKRWEVAKTYIDRAIKGIREELRKEEGEL